MDTVRKEPQIVDYDYLRAQKNKICRIKHRIDDISRLKDFDAVVVDCLEESEARSIIDDIRHFVNVRVALMPIFLLREDEVDSDLKSTVDGIGREDEISSHMHARTAVIKDRIRDLHIPQVLNGYTPEGLFARHLLFYLSRGRRHSTTVESSLNHKGYFRSMLDHLSLKNSSLDLTSAVGHFEQLGAVKKKILDHVHTCPDCHNGHLLIRESCPKCHSTQVSASELVHHFSCAHVAPIDQFLKHDEWQQHMECPKCNKILKHIGVDYDKPSQIYKCDACTHVFQQGNVKAKCCGCQRESAVKDLVKVSIEQYEILCDHHQLVDLIREEDTKGKGPVEFHRMDSAIIDFQGAETIVGKHPGAHRNTENGKRSPWFYVKIHDLSGLSTYFSEGRVNELMDEIESVIRSSISRDDQIVREGEIFRLTQNNRDERKAQNILSCTAQLIEELLATNQGITLKVESGKISDVDRKNEVCLQ